MTTNTPGSEDHSANGTLPESLQKLITKNLERKLREQEILWSSEDMAIINKWRDAMAEAIRDAPLYGKSTGESVIAMQIRLYREFVAYANSATDRWPEIVWLSISPHLEHSEFEPEHYEGLSKLIDHFVWKSGTKPFTLDRINPTNFRKLAFRSARTLGKVTDVFESRFDSELSHAWTKAESEILDAGTESRNRLDEKIAQFISARWPNASSIIPTGAPPHNAKSPVGPGKAIRPGQKPEVGSPEWRASTAKKAADAKHDKPGGSREKRRAIQDIWASGKYSTRDRCAEEECAALGMSFSAARKALINTPKPHT